MRVIFVPVADRPECAVALNKTFELAGDLGCRAGALCEGGKGEKADCTADDRRASEDAVH